MSRDSTVVGHTAPTSAKTLVYVGQCCDLHWPQHLTFASTKILACTCHNTGHNIGHNIYLHRPKHLFMSASAVTCIGHNTSHLRPQRYWPEPAKTQVTTLACINKNTCLHRLQYRPAAVKILACVNKIVACAGQNTGLPQ